MKRYLALGDSYTIGEGVEPADRWPSKVAELLRAEGLRIGNPEIIARTGWTTGELDEAIDTANPSFTFDLVSLLIGVNDQYRGMDIVGFRERFAALVGRAMSFAAGLASHVIIVSIPDWGVTPFARAKGRDLRAVGDEIDAFNTVVRDEAARAGARFVDVTPVSRLATEDLSLLTSDGLHPAAAMYDFWAKLILADARAALRERG